MLYLAKTVCKKLNLAKTIVYAETVVPGKIVAFAKTVVLQSQLRLLKH